MTIPTNRDRASRIDAIARLYEPFSGDDPADFAGDLLGDLRHWCQRRGVSFAAADRRGRWHFEDEIFDEEVVEAPDDEEAE